MSESSRQFDRGAFLGGSVAILATEQSGDSRSPLISDLCPLSSPRLTASSLPPACHPALRDDLRSCCERKFRES
jgi:hypothetical protein